MEYEKKTLQYWLEKNLKNDLPGSTNSLLMQNILTQAIKQMETIEQHQLEIVKLREMMSHNTK